MSNLDVNEVARRFRQLGIPSDSCKSLEDARALALNLASERAPASDPLALLLLFLGQMLTDAPSVSAEELDFEPDDSRYGWFQRMVRRKRGSWYRLPHDLPNWRSTTFVRASCS
jgi:hypothetical protein